MSVLFAGYRGYITAGLALGFACGAWNFLSFWLDPLDDSIAGMLLIYLPMFTIWAVAGFVAARRRGRLVDAVGAGAVIAFATFLVFWILNFVRVHVFLDTLYTSPDWQTTVVARYHVSGFETFRGYVIYEYLMDAPLKLAAPTVIGVVLASVGGVAGLFGWRRRLAAGKHGSPL